MYAPLDDDPVETMSISDALEIVHGLAQQSAQGGSIDAIDALGDLVDNSHEEIDSEFGPLDADPDVIELSEIDFPDGRPSGNIRVCLAMAESHIAWSEHSDRDRHAVGVTRAFLLEHGQSLDSRLTSILVP